MEDLTENIAAEKGSANLLSKFGELPSGVQRVFIAVLVIVVLIALMFIQRLIKTEEAVSEGADFMETMDTGSA
jgi:hypothetical protein